LPLPKQTVIVVQNLKSIRLVNVAENHHGSQTHFSAHEQSGIIKDFNLCKKKSGTSPAH